jgi:uncharacterized protein DUF6636
LPLKTSARLAAVALLALAAAAGCGSDDDETTAATTSTAASAGCPTDGAQESDPVLSDVGPLLAVQATIDCDEVRALGEDVLSRDDCVEETPGGANGCTSGEFACETTIEGAAPTFLVTECVSESDEASFRYEIEQSGPTEGGAPPEPEPEELTSFSTPSGNIGCVMDPEFVRCDIAERSWEPPPAPSDCEVDFGQGVQISGQRRGQLVCAGDTTLGSEETLEYGQTSKVGPYRCISAEAGITCQDSRTGHGFFLSKQTYELY